MSTAFYEDTMSQKIKNTIKHMWHLLTDDEIAACDEERDIFFLAVRKKHGLVRAQAEMILNDLRREFRDAA